MRRGTTPTIIIRVTGATFEDSTVYVTLKQCDTVLTKTSDDISISVEGNNSVISVYLSQEETLMFAKGELSIQIRWINSSGNAQASPIKKLEVDPILMGGVIQYAD